MILKNARVKNDNGFRFIEKDILKDDYILQGDASIALNIDYITPGFGVAIYDSNESDSSINNAYLFKIGYKEASIYHSNSTSNKLEKQITDPRIFTIKENLDFKLVKSGKKITMYVNNEKILDHYIKNEMIKYSISYYSNKDNKINSIKIKSATPNGWNINMDNTIGGYVKFADDTVILTQCIQDAEIEQHNILLEAGRYYVNYKVEDNTCKNDIKMYVHKSKDDRLYNDEKNILRNGSFTLVEDEYVNLKIVGRDGIVKEIFISKYPDDDYISTTDNSVVFNGSYVNAYLDGLTRLTWKGCVTKIPNFMLNNKKEIYGVVLDNSNIVKPEDIKISLGTENEDYYMYEFNAISHIFTVKDYKGKLIYKSILSDVINKITIFKNLSGRIKEFILYKKNGEIINVNIQDELKQYVPSSIESPIIITDEYNYPFDLSSAYRKSFLKDGIVRFIFTNWEREIYKVNERLITEKEVSNNDGSICIYGIKKGFDFDIDNIYNIYDDNINSIDLFTQNYDVIDLKDVLYHNKVTREIILNSGVKDKYSHFVIDYLKENSYAINFSYSKQAYAIDISTSSKKFNTIYNSKEIDEKNHEINTYVTTNLMATKSGYIVLRRGEE